MMSEHNSGKPLHLFGDIAASMGFLDDRQLLAALHRQNLLRMGRAPMRLGEVMTSLKILSDEQLHLVIQEQSRLREAGGTTSRNRHGDTPQSS